VYSGRLALTIGEKKRCDRATPYGLIGRTADFISIGTQEFEAVCSRCLTVAEIGTGDRRITRSALRNKLRS
jgi:hypothetical protein